MQKRQFLQLAGGFAAGAALSGLMPAIALAAETKQKGKGNKSALATIYDGRQQKLGTLKIVATDKPNVFTLFTRVGNKTIRRPLTAIGSEAAFAGVAEPGRLTLKAKSAGKTHQFAATLAQGIDGTTLVDIDGSGSDSVQPQSGAALVVVGGVAIVGMGCITIIGVAGIAAIVALSGKGKLTVSGKSDKDGMSVEASAGEGEEASGEEGEGDEESGQEGGEDGGGED